MPGAPSSFLFLVVRPGAPSSVLAPNIIRKFSISKYVDVVGARFLCGVRASGAALSAFTSVSVV